MRLFLISLTITVILVLFRLCFIHSSVDVVVDKSVWGQGTTEELTNQTKSKLKGLAAGIRVYRKIHGKIPITGVDLIQEFKRGKVSLARCAETMFDSWGNQIIYDVKNSKAVLTSAGADGKIETADDVVLKVDILEGSNMIWGYSEEMTFEQSLKVYGE